MIPPCLNSSALLVSLVVLFCPGTVARAAEPRLELLEERAFQAAVEHVAPAVVQLHIIGGSNRVDDVNLGDGPATGTILSSTLR